MRILHVSRYGSVRGGAETYLRALCGGLRDAGHQVSMVYGLDPDPEWPEAREGFRLAAVAETAEPGEEAIESLRDVVKDAAPDVVHVHAAEVAWVPRAIEDLAPVLIAAHDHRLNCPVSTKYWTAWRRRCQVPPGPWCLAYNVTAHCGSLKANATLRPYRTWRDASDAARARTVQVFSEAMRAELQTAGFDQDRVVVTPYPVPPLAAPLPPADDDDRPVVLAVGRLNPEKGMAELVRALAWVETPVHLVIVGSGHDRDRIETEARRAPAIHRITLTGWLSPGHIAGWMERAALVAVPSMWPEPFGIVGLEAMARGRAVVAFESGGISEWLEDGVTGRLVPRADIPALGRAVGALAGEGDLRHRMGEAGAERTIQRHSLVGHVERLLPIYEQVRRDRETAT